MNGETVITLEGRLALIMEADDWATENLKPGTWRCDLVGQPWGLLILRRVIETKDVSHIMYPWRLPSGAERIYTIEFFFSDDVSHVHFKLRWK